jgi:hypothetical protein
MSLRSGYAQAIITPSLDKPVYLAGFGRDRRAETVHDELYVRALALADGPVMVVAIAIDLLGLGREHCQEIERRVNQKAPGTHLLIACTHTHHGPDTLGLWGPNEKTSGVDCDYMARLKEKITETALVALDRMLPSLVKSAAVKVSGVAKNARDPEILDEELTCLQFSHELTKKISATWFIYPCHPEVLWEHNPHITSDYIYSLRAQAEATTDAPCLAMVGALGGMMTPDVVEHSFSEAKVMGEILAAAGLTALAKSQEEMVELSYRRQRFAIPLQNPLFKLAAEAGLLTADLVEADTVSTEANLLKLGGTWFFGVPGELLPALGLDYRRRMKEAGGSNAAIISLVNDELGYILPAEAFVPPTNYMEPGDSYEESMSVGREAGPLLTQALEALLSKG